MKSKKVKELLEKFEPDRVIDLPRRFTESEVERLVEIAEIEASGDVELLEKKVEEFMRWEGMIL